MDLQTKAIILKTYKLNEADKILHLLTPNFGPIKAVAKSAMKSSFTSKTQVLQVVDLLLAKGRNLDIVKEAKLIEDWKNLPKDYSAINSAYLIINVIDAISVNDNSSQTYYNLTLENLAKLNQSPINQHDRLITLIDFFWQIIYLQGYTPQLNTCLHSGKTRQVNQIPRYFDFAFGSIVSSAAYEEINSSDNSVSALAPGVFKILCSLEECRSIKEFDNQSLINTINFLHKHLESCLNTEFKSWKSFAADLSGLKILDFG